MSLYVIADLHLSVAHPDKSMDVFGRRWNDYTEKLNKNWRAIVTDEDTVVIPGDISWGLTLSDALPDFLFLESLPGKKIIGKGNHDFWWTTAAKTERFFAENRMTSISLLYNNAYLCEDFVICGTRGWYYDPSGDKIPPETDYQKMILREAARLQLSIDAADRLLSETSDKERLAFLHFPPIWNGQVITEIAEVLQKNRIKRVFFGHIHGTYTVPRSFEADGVSYALISADFLNFCPCPIFPASFYG